jgi:hypothetical protein
MKIGALLLPLCLMGVAPTPAPTTDPCAGLLAELNRPTVGYSPCAVERGTTVLELGYQHETIGTPAQATSQMQLGQGFLRFGVARRFELDVIGPNIVLQRGVAGIANGFADSGLGFKYELPTTPRWQIGFDGLYTTPNGAAALTSGNAAYIANLDASYQLTPATSFASTLSLASSGGFGANGAHARYGTFTPSALVLEQINALTQVYIEYVDPSRSSPDIGNRAFIDAGLQRLLGEHVEIDVEYGHALTGDSRLRFNYVGAGFGVLVGR